VYRDKSCLVGFPAQIHGFCIVFGNKKPDASAAPTRIVADFGLEWDIIVHFFGLNQKSKQK